MRTYRLISIPLIACLVLGAAACGGDDDNGQSAEERFCEAGDELQSQVSGLADMDVVAEGTDALESRFDEIGITIDELRDAGADIAEDELSALESAFDELEEAFDAISGGNITAEAASALVALDDACP